MVGAALPPGWRGGSIGAAHASVAELSRAISTELLVALGLSRANRLQELLRPLVWPPARLASAAGKPHSAWLDHIPQRRLVVGSMLLLFALATVVPLLFSGLFPRCSQVVSGRLGVRALDLAALLLALLACDILAGQRWAWWGALSLLDSCWCRRSWPSRVRLWPRSWRRPAWPRKSAKSSTTCPSRGLPRPFRPGSPS